MILHRILLADLPAWVAAGWSLVGGSYCPSLRAHVALVEWRGAGEAVAP